MKSYYKRKAFGNNYDPNNGYDPSVMHKFNNADGSQGGQPGSATQQAKPGQKMQINVKLNNNTAQVLTFELWNYLNSMLRVQNNTYAVGNYLYIPLDSWEGIKATAAGTDKTVGAAANGDVVIRGDGTVPDPVGTISCKEIAYASFFQASGITAFNVAWFRYTVTSDAQIDNIITWFQKSMAGGVKQNPISPRSYFDPNQFQAKTIDILTNFNIGIDKGLFLQLQTGETVTLALFIENWTLQTLG